MEDEEGGNCVVAVDNKDTNEISAPSQPPAGGEMSFSFLQKSGGWEPIYGFSHWMELLTSHITKT